MGHTLVSLSGLQRGNELAETGVNLESFSCRYFYQFKDKLNDFQGVVRGFAIPDKFDREVTLEAEVSSIGSLSGIMLTTGNTALVFANDVGTFIGVASGSNAGGFYLDEITESQSRDGWRRVSGQWSSNPGVT